MAAPRADRPEKRPPVAGPAGAVPAGTFAGTKQPAGKKPQDDEAYIIDCAHEAQDLFRNPPYASADDPIHDWLYKAITHCHVSAGETKKLVPDDEAINYLERIGQSITYQSLTPGRMERIRGFLIDKTRIIERVVNATVYRPGRPPASLADKVMPEWLCDYKVEPVVVIAAGVFFASRAGLMHGPDFGGKSTLLANVVARIVTGRPWLGQPTVPGKAIIMAEEFDTYAKVIEQAGANVDKVIHPVERWSDLATDIARYKPVVVVVDTFQFAAWQVGAVDTNQAGDVDAVLRPLERLSRKYGCGVIVTDHEPQAETGTGTKSRPRGSRAKGGTADYMIRCTHEGNVTTVEPGRGARLGIKTFSFAVDAHGRPTVDRPAELPPAVTGAAGEAAAAGDDQPFVAVLADLSKSKREKWIAMRPAIEAMLTTEPTVTDRSICGAVGLPSGGRDWRAATAYLAAIRTAMLTVLPGKTPGSTSGSTSGSTMEAMGSEAEAHSEAESGRTASAPLGVEARPEARPGSRSNRDAASIENLQEGGDHGENQRASGADNQDTRSTDVDAASGENDDGAPPCQSDRKSRTAPPGVVAPESSGEPCDQTASVDQPAAPVVETAPVDPTAQRLAMVAAALTGDGDTNAPLPHPSPADVAATAERVHAVLGDRSLADLTADAQTAAADALAGLLTDGSVEVRTLARRLRDGGTFAADDYLLQGMSD